jgi:hypothetical protein
MAVEVEPGQIHYGTDDNIIASSPLPMITKLKDEIYKMTIEGKILRPAEILDIGDSA